MASFTLTIQGALGGAFGDLTTTFEVSDDDSDRILAFVQATYGTDAEGAARTPQQAVDAYAQSVMDEVIRRVKVYERELASQQAAAAVATIPVTKV